MMEQEIQTLKLKDLVLWTENPRDPIDENATDQDIVNKAMEDKHSKWSLPKLAKEMGDHYDFSELPTVVYHGKKPVVYDGNRRIILGKIKLNLVTVEGKDNIEIPEIPAEIPCNVCSKQIALKNVYRKHSDSGSWHPLERDIFLHKFMGEKKSTFLIIEENTELITTHPHLNQRFVKDEILREDILSEMGFDIKGNKLRSVHDENQVLSILHNLSQKIQDKEITTRHNRGKVIDVLDKPMRKIIEKNKGNQSYNNVNIQFTNPTKEDREAERKQRQTKRTQKKEDELFGKKLYLKSGDVNNLYRDISDLYQIYLNNKSTLSHSFPSLIRMSLRLLCESAAKDINVTLDKYLNTHFANAKKSLDQDIKTSLSNQNVTEKTILQLLHTGAHNYQAANNLPQTYAISVILGEMLTLTHGKEN